MANTSMGDLASKMGGTTPTRKTEERPPPPSRPAVVAPPVEPTVEPPAEPAAEEAATDEEAAPQPTRVRTVARSVPTSAQVSVRRPVRQQAMDLPPVAEKGDLVQARVQPPDIGELTNNLIDNLTFCFRTTRGAALGAVLLVALDNFDQLVELMETWRGEPSDATRHMVWQVVQKQMRERIEGAVFDVSEPAPGDRTE